MMHEDTIGCATLVGTEAGYTLRQIRDIYPETPFEFLTDPMFCKFTIWGKVDPSSNLHFQITGLKGHLAPLDLNGDIIGTPPEKYDIDAGSIISRESGVTWFDVRPVPITSSLRISTVIDGAPLNDYIRYIVYSPELDIYHGSARHPFLGEILISCLGESYSGRRLYRTTRFPPFREIEDRLRDANYELREGENIEEIVRISTANISVILSYLECGTISADGVFPKTMMRIKIDSRTWQRKGLSIDLYNGDIVDLASGEIEFRDVIIRAPIPFERSNKARVDVADVSVARLKGSTKGTMVEAVRDVFLERWRSDTPAGMGRKEIDPIIRERLGFSRDGNKPSTRTIAEGIKLARAEIAERRG